jgi:hypothetical protein
MICLEVSLNGDVICTAGTTQGTVNVDLMRLCYADHSETEITLRETVFRPASKGDDLAPKLRAALQHPERPPSTQSVNWIDRKKLKPGDEITIKLIDLPVNPPTSKPDAAVEPD